MPRYLVGVVEVRHVQCFYLVEADDPDDARRKAREGIMAATQEDTTTLVERMVPKSAAVIPVDQEGQPGAIVLVAADLKLFVLRTAEGKVSLHSLALGCQLAEVTATGLSAAAGLPEFLLSLPQLEAIRRWAATTGVQHEPELKTLYRYLRNHPQELEMKPKPRKFPVGAFAFSKHHQALVRVMTWDRNQATVTRGLYPDGLPLPGAVAEADLLTMSEFEAWAPTQPWYVLPTR